MKYEEPRKAGRTQANRKRKILHEANKRKLWVSRASKLELTSSPEGKTTHRLKTLSIRQTR